MNKFQVVIQEGKEVLIIEVDAMYPRLAFEQGISGLGYAPHKFTTTVDQEASNTRRVVYQSVGIGGTLLVGFVKPLKESTL